MSGVTTFRSPVERNSRLSTNGRPYSNLGFGRSGSNTSTKSSIRQAFVSSSCSNHVFPSRLSLKTIKPEPWQRLFDDKKQRGVKTIKKNKLNIIDMSINEDFNASSYEQLISNETSQYSFLPEAIQTHINHLHEQIDELVLELSEERFKHKQTRLLTGEILSNQSKDHEKRFEIILQQKKLSHENELKDNENKFNKLLKDEQMQYIQREKQLRNELEFVKNSFHSYKINLESEKTNNFQIKSNEKLSTTKNEQIQIENELIEKKINEAIRKERKLLNKKHKIELENLQKQNHQEIDTINKTLMEKIDSLDKELRSTKLENDTMKQRTIDLTTQLKNLELQHIETTRELNDYRIRFDEKNK